MPQTASYGSWPSPISAERVLEASVRLEQVRVGNRSIWWSELRPSESGRSQIVRRDAAGNASDVLPEGFSASCAVHEYGGGAWWLAGDTVFFVNTSDQRIWRLDPDFAPVAITPEPEQPRGLRYADGIVTADQRWIICVQEVHPGELDHDGRDEAMNRIVAVPATGGPAVALRDVADFVMSPRLDPDGELLAWVEWNHPDMPWDGSELWVGRLEITAGAAPLLRAVERVAGGPEESITEPTWHADGHLWFVSDRSDFWNLYRFGNAGVPVGDASAVCPGTFEVGAPAWVFGSSHYAFLGDDRVVFAYSSDGIDHLGCAYIGGTGFEHVSVPFTSIDQVRAVDSTAVRRSPRSHRSWLR